MNGIWAVLGIEPTHDRDTVRRAYAARLKSTNPEDDAEGFQRLRAAYETALRFCRTPAPAAPPPPAEPEIVSPPETGAPTEAQTPPASPPRPSFRPAPARPVMAPADVLSSPAPVVPLAATQRLQLEAGLRRLAALLAGRQASTPETLRTALDEILASPALEDISIYDGTERRLAQLIAAHIPASDPLIEPACKVFAWSLERRGRIAREAEAVLQRAEDLKFLRLYQSPRHPRHRAYRALAHKSSDRMRRMQAFLHPRLAKDVKGLIEAVEFRAPTAIANFDPEALAWWRAFLAQPATGPIAIYVSLGVALAAALASRTGTAAPDLGVTVAVFLLSLMACGAVVLGWLYGVARPRRRWRTERQRNATLLERFGWAPLSWLLLLASGLLPNNAVAVVLALAAALATTWWVFVVGEPDRRPGGRGWRYRMLLAQIPPLVWWIMLVDPASGPRAAQSVAFAGALAASVIGGGSQLFWYHAELIEPARRRGRLVVAAGGVLAALALAAAAQRLLPIPVMAALVATYVFAHRPIVANLRGTALQARYWVGVIAVLTLPSAGVALHWPVAIEASLWLMLTTTAGLLFSWTQDQPPLRKRKKAGPKAAPAKR